MFAFLLVKTRYKLACVVGLRNRDHLAGRVCDALWRWNEQGLPGRRFVWAYDWVLHYVTRPLAWICGSGN
jgi:hypothetical protein